MRITNSNSLPPADRGLTRAVVRWFESHGRDYAWRFESNPFLVLTAEILLQRTRADQVLPVYLEISEKTAGPADILRLGPGQVDTWFQRLGLRWRARLYLQLCRVLVDEHSGAVPATRSELMQLPGVGQYAAGATLNCAFGIPAGMVDSNMLRIYGRYFGIEFGDSDRRRKDVLAWAADLVPAEPGAARSYNLGLVDLGADVCSARSPRCEVCPLAIRCAFALRADGDVSLPIAVV